MAKAKRRRKKRIFLLCTFSIIMIFVTCFSTFKYWVEIYDKYQENKKYDTELKKLKKKEAALKADVNKMQDADYIARYAREKYLYSKEGEFILNIK